MKTVKRRLLVIIARDVHQYKYFVFENKLNPQDCIYPNLPEKIAGLRDFDYIKIGNFFENPIYDPEFFDRLHAYGGKEITKQSLISQKEEI